MAADGSFVIDTGMNNAGFKAGSRELKSALKSLESTTNKVGQQMSKSGSGFTKSMGQQARAAQSFKTQIKDLEAEAAKLKSALEIKGKTQIGYTDEYKKIQNTIEETEAKITELQKKQQTWAETGMPTNSGAFQEVDQQIQDLIKQIDELQAKQTALRGRGIITGADTAEYAEMQRQLQATEDKIQELRGTSADVGGSIGQAFSAIGSAAGRAVVGVARLAVHAGKAAASLAKMAGHGILSFLKKLASGAANAAVQLAKLTARAASSGLKKLGSMVGSAARGIFSIGKNAKSSGNGLKIGLKNILKYAFGIRSLFFLFRRLRAAVNDGLGAIAQKNPEVKAALNGLKGALNGLKASLGTAFAPILTAIAPALTTLINLLTTAINTIGAFFAALTGQGFFQKATASIAGTGGAAKSASGSVKELKRQLAGFDELEILTENDSGGGGGGGGGGGSGSGFSYETVEIGEGIKEFADQLRELWAAADFEGIGRLIADKMNEMLAKAKELISWDNLGESITKGIEAITGIINGFVAEFDWELLGRTFGEGINTFAKTVTTFFKKIDLKAAGSALATAINGLVDETSFNGIAEAIETGVNKIIGGFGGFVEAIKPEELAQKFTTALNRLIQHVEWRELTDAMSFGFNKVVGALLEGATTFEWGQAGKQFSAAVNNLIAKANFDVLGNTMKTMFSGALDMLIEAAKTFSWGEAGTKFGDLIAGLYDPKMFGKLGTLFATGINGAIKMLHNALAKFSWVTDGGLDLGKSFADGVNTLNDKVDWDALGRLLGGGLQTAINVFKGYVLEFNWGYAGIKFGQFVNSIVDSIDPDAIAQSIKGALLGALSAGINAINTTDWAVIGNKIRVAVTKIPWKSIAEKIWELLKSALSAAGDLISALFSGEKEVEIPVVVKPAQANTPNGQAKLQTEADKAAGGTSDSVWAKFAGSISDSLLSILDGIRNIVKNDIDWLGMGRAVHDAVHDVITNIDWSSLLSSLWETIKEILSAILGDLLPALLYGENYQNSLLWRTKHPQEAIAYDREHNPQKVAAAEAVVDKVNEWLGLEPGETTEESPLDLVMKAAIKSLNKATGAVEENSEVVDDNTDATGKSTDATEQLPWATVGEVDSRDFNWDDAYYEWGDGGTVDVGVNYYPEGQSPNSQFSNTGLGKWLRQITDPKTPVETKVELLKQGWTTLQTFLGTNSTFGAFISVFASLFKKNNGESSGTLFGTIISVFASLFKNKNGVVDPATLFGTIISVLASLGKKNPKKDTPTNVFGTALGVLATLAMKAGSKTVAGLYGTTLKVTAEIRKKKNNKITWTGKIGRGGNTFELSALGGYTTRTGMHRFASGGIIRGSGHASWYNSIPRYAAGGLTRGTIFAAGEAGPEVVGHIGGRTEVLNKSQIAQAIYSAVVAGMTAVVNRMTFHIPNMATGSVLPYDVVMQMQRSNAELQTTLDANNEDLIQTIISVVTAQTTAIVGAINNQNRGGGVSRINAQQIINEINQRTQMFNASPLKGV